MQAIKDRTQSPALIGLGWESLNHYLSDRHKGHVTIDSVRALGIEANDDKALKHFGYGHPLLVTYRYDNRRYREVFHTIRRNQFGRERFDDHAAAVLLDYQTFSKLPNHVPAVDVAVYDESGDLHSFHNAHSLHVVTTYCEGEVYANDLLRLRDGGFLKPNDEERTGILARYLAGIHSVRHDDDWLWRRRLRDLVGHGEGVMGLVDSYPNDFRLPNGESLNQLEAQINSWRWRLKPHTERLCQVHGDFHPFNILFDDDNQLTVLDRSRGEWGAAADDVACLTINYLFFALQCYGRLTREFETLHTLFWETYLAQRPDDELTRCIQPWLAWRVLVLASPIWYPTIGADVRAQLFNFAVNVLDSRDYDWRNINDYL